jgi:Peptidase family M48
MRATAIALCCVFAAFCTACISDSTDQSDSHPSTNLASLGSERDRLAEVAARIALALADVCQCRTEPGSPSTAPRLCGYPIKIENTTELHASTNGHRIRITSGMLEFFASDDELAFVLAHELSHILLGHAGAFNGLSPAAAEMEADRLGIRIVSHADFDAEIAAKFPVRLAQSYPEMNRLGGAYPRPAARSAMIGAALREDSGQPIRVKPRDECTG